VPQKKVFIVVAVNGGNQQDRDGARVPVTPEEIGLEARRCQEAGASVLHVHARDPITGEGTGDPAIFGEVIRAIRNETDILIQTTTGIGTKRNPTTGEVQWASHAERLQLLAIEPPQDLVTVAMGTWDFVHPAGNQPTARTYHNTPDFLRANIAAINKAGLPWEMEVAEIGFLHNALRLAEEGVFDPSAENFWIDYLLGYGGMPATARQLIAASEEGMRLFPQAPWEVNATGRDEFPMNVVGLGLGCDMVRVGFEDSLYMPDGSIAAHNHDQVRAMAEIARLMGREVGSVAEARGLLRMQ
jgi:3-keto-5-aminohexanoate cleavage enzyme